MARNRGIFARRPLLEPAAVRAGIRESRRFASPRARALSDIAGPRVSRVPAVAAICSRLSSVRCPCLLPVPAFRLWFRPAPSVALKG